MVILTYQEAKKKHGSRYGVDQALNRGELRHIGRNLYSTDDDDEQLKAVLKLYPDAIATGQTALYLHGLIDLPPDLFDLASKRGGTKIASDAVRQTFIPEGWLGLGATAIVHDGTSIRIYDLERMLLEVMRSRNKLPYDIYREAIGSYRRLAENLDIYKLEAYADAMPRGQSYLNRALEEVF